MRGFLSNGQRGNEPMRETKTRDIARMLMRTHGLRAHAVAQEHASQARAKGDATGAEHWAEVSRRVQELRGHNGGVQPARSAASATAPSAMR